MAQNTLMFEVGVGIAEEEFKGIKTKIDNYVGEWKKDMSIKVEIANLNELTNQLKNLGDNQSLRNLRQEIASLNNEFAKLAAGAGGTGTMAIRSLNQSIVEAQQDVARYQRILEQLRKEQGTLKPGTTRFDQIAKTIEANEVNLKAAQKSVNDFNAKLASIGQNMNVSQTAKDFANVEQKVEGVNVAILQMSKSMTAFITQMREANGASAQGGIFDPAKFQTLQEAIDKVVREVNRLATALSGIKFDGLTSLTTAINTLQLNANGVSSALKSIDSAVKFDKSAEDVKNYETRVTQLKEQIAQLEAQMKNMATSAAKMNSEFKAVSEKPGREETKNANLDALQAHINAVSKALERMQNEYGRLEKEGGFDAGLKAKIDKLRDYHEWLLKIKDGHVDLSKAGALKSTAAMFDGNVLMGKVVKQWYSEKEMKGFAKTVDDLIAGKKAAESLNEAFERMKQKMLGVGTEGTGGMRGVSANLETINKVGELNIQTLIKEQGHIERLIALAQQSIKFGEKYDVMGMGEKRSQQRANLEYLENVKRMIDYILQNRNQPEWMRFLNTSSSLRLPLPGSGNDIALLGGHFDQLTHNVKTTAQAMRQLKTDMSLEGTNWNKQWNTDNLTRGLYNVETAIKNIMDAWSKVSATASPEMAKAVAQQVNNLNAIKREITAAMDNQSVLGSRHGYATAMDANYHIQLKEAKALQKEMNDLNKANEKSTKQEQAAIEKRLKAEERVGAARVRAREKEEREYARAFEKGMRERERADQKSVNDALKQQAQGARDAAKENDMWAKSMDNARAKAYALKLVVEQLEKRSKAAEKLGINVTGINAQIDNMKNVLSRLQALSGGAKIHGTSQSYLQSSEYKNAMHDANAAIKVFNGEMKNAEKNMKLAANEADKLKKTIRNLSALEYNASKLGIDTTRLRSHIAELENAKKTLEQISRTNGLNAKSYVRDNRFLDIKRDAKEVAASVQKGMKDAMKVDDENTKSLREYVSLLRQIASLKSTANKAESFGIDTRTLRNQIALLENYAKSLDAITGRKGVGFNAWTSATPAYSDARYNSSAEQARLQSEIAKKKEENAAATLKLTDAEHQFTNAINKGNESMRGQSQVLSDLKMMATQYLSIWGAQSFVNKIIETGGQLEQQRMSLGAILGDMEHATTLFDQIKQLALKSPFGVVQLDQMSKQLAAYSFEYEELFEWTKRLADISAATGTEVSRLALALGHVRSEGALSGYTLRQFAMANVPVLRMLSENLGISSKEVRERVRKKDISAEDVQDILRQLTDDGGMFANAQEMMSEALNAKFKNLRDAFDIMYGEIAEGGVGDALKNLASILTDGAKHWERLGKDIFMVAAAMGVGKGVMLLYNKAIGEGTAATLRSAFVAKERMVANLKLTQSYRQLTVEEEAELAMQRKWWSFGSKLNSRNIALLLSTNKLTVAELERAVAMKKVSKEDALAAMNLLKLNTVQMQSVKVLGFWGRLWATISNGARLASLAIKSFLSSVAPLLALTAVFELWNRRSEQKDAAAEMANSMAGSLPGRAAADLYGNLGDSRKLSREALQGNVEEMKNALVVAGAYTKELKEQVDKTQDLTAQYDILKKKIKEVSDEYEEGKAAQEQMFNEAFDAGGGFLSDNMLEDTKQYDTAFSEFSKAITIGSKQIRESLEEWMKVQGLYKDEFSDMTGKQLFEQLSEQDQSRFLGGGDRSIYRSRGYDESTRDALENISDARSKVKDKLEEMRSEQGRDFARIMKAMYEEAFKVDLDHAKQEQVNDFDKWLRETIGRAKDLSANAKEALRGIVIDFSIKLRPNYVVEQPKSAQEVIDEAFEDNKFLGGFFKHQSPNLGSDAIEGAKQQTKKYQKLLGDISLSNIDSAVDKINKMLDSKEKTSKSLANTLASSVIPEDQKEEIRKAKKENDDDIEILNDALEYVNGKRVRKGDTSKENKADNARAKAVRERVRVIKEAADAFEYWRNKVGDDAAWVHVEEEFGSVLKTVGVTAKNVSDLKGNLKGVLNSKEFGAIRDGKVKTEIQKEVAKDTAQIDRKDWEKESAENLSIMNKQLEDLTRRWEIFNSVRENTGDIEMAQRLAGLTPEEMGMRNSADAAKGLLSATYQGIDFGEVYNLDDKGIEEYVKKLGVSEKQISAVVNALKQWRDLQRNIFKNDLINLSKIIGSTEDYESQIKKIDDNLAKTIKDINASDSSQEDKDKATNLVTARSEFEKEQLSANFRNVFDNAMALSSEAFDTEVRRIEVMLNTLFANKGISAEKMTEWQNKIFEARKNYATAGFLGMRGSTGAFLGGGYEGLLNYRTSRLAALRNERNNTKEGSAERKKLDDQIEEQENLVKSTTKTVDAMNKISKAANMASDAMGLLTDLFTNMGADGAATVASDAGGILSGMMGGASSLSALGPYGMAAGAALGLASGLFALHDKSIQREIDAIKDQVDALESNTEAIKAARERTLGYDTGDLRRSLAQRYQQYDVTRRIRLLGLDVTQTSNTKYGEAGLAMGKYYGMNTMGSGYMQELANMKEEREDYIKMYNLEKEKKNESQDALNEYRDKIAELDDQITFYIEDLTGELWGIDFKSWADQIGDALWTAFENGEDAVKAFRDTATSIISEVARKMGTIHFLEPAFKELEDKLFGTIDSNGNRTNGAAYNATTGELDEEATLRALGEFFGEGGTMEKSMENYQRFFELAERATGMDFSSDDSSSTSSGIKGITEQTADLLASYINSIRADVAVDRAMIAQYFPLFYNSMTRGNASLVNIENHTAAIMRSNDVIAERITSLDASLSGLRNKTWKVPVA